MKLLCCDDEGLPMILCTQQVYYDSIYHCIVICCLFDDYYYSCSFSRYSKIIRDLMDTDSVSIIDLGIHIDISEED